VLWAAWGVLGVCIEGWRSLGAGSPRTSPAVTPPDAEEDILRLVTAEGGYWQFAGLPWKLQVSGTVTAEAPKLVEPDANHPVLPGAGYRLTKADLDGLRGLVRLGVATQETVGDHLRWRLAADAFAVELSMTTDGRLQGALLARRDPQAGQWRSYTMEPLETSTTKATSLVPDSANPQRVAARFTRDGLMLLEVAFVSDEQFLKPLASDKLAGQSGWSASQQEHSDHRVTYRAFRDRPAQPALVIAIRHSN